MPPLSTKSEKKMKLFKVEENVWDEMVQLQTVDGDSKTTDVHLTCLDGFIPAHAFVLRSISTFFDCIFMSQGEYYPVVRNILLPDYKISQVRAVIQLIYSGSSSIENQKEADAVSAIMKEWKIENKGLEFQKVSSNKGSKKPKKVVYYVYSPEEARKQARVNSKFELKSEVKMEEVENSFTSSASSSIEQPQKDTSASSSIDQPQKDKAVSPFIDQPQKDTSASSFVDQPQKDKPASSFIDQPQKGRSVSPETVNPKVSVERRSLRPRATLKKRLNVSNDDSEEEKTASPSGGSETSESEESDNGRRKRNPRKASTSAVRSSGRPTRSTAKGSSTPKVPEIITSDNDDEASHMSTTDESGTESDLEDGNPRRKGKKKAVKGKQSVGFGSRNIPTRGSGSKLKLNDSESEGEVEVPTLQTPSVKSSSDSDSEGSSDDVKSFYKNPNLFAEAAKVCGKCNKKYSNPKEASDCITERHKLVRCYFCFDVCANTEKLFLHYGDKHKKAGRENTLLCPFCQQGVPYKSVSTHVISNHLFATSKNKNIEQGRVGQVGRPSGRFASANISGPKRMKVGPDDEPSKKQDEVPEKESDDSDDNLMVSTSNMLIKKRSASGKMKVFLLEKDKN